MKNRKKDRHINNIERECSRCGNLFYTRQYLVDKGYGKFCSRKCSASAGGEAFQNKYPVEIHPKATHVRYLSLKAIREGRLIKQPCEVCGTKDNIDAHHDDYEEPYKVRWLCKKHHAMHHIAKRIL